jgi:hypothetical protein
VGAAQALRKSREGSQPSTPGQVRIGASSYVVRKADSGATVLRRCDLRGGPGLGSSSGGREGQPADGGVQDQAAPDDVGSRYRDSGSMSFHDVDWIDWYCINWARWMRTGEQVQGYPHKVNGMVNRSIFSAWEDMTEAMDRRLAAITDSVINDLVPAQSCALHHAYLDAVYRFSEKYPFHRALEDGKDNLMAGLKKKGVWTQ